MESKEKQQRIALAGILLAILLYSIFGLLLAPLRIGAAALRTALADTKQQIAAASKELHTLRSQLAADDLPAMDALAERLMSSVPKSHLVTTPSAIAAILSRHNLGKGQIRPTLMVPFVARTDLIQAAWTVRTTEADSLRWGLLVADLENAFPMGHVTEVALEANTATGTVGATVVLQIAVYP